MTLLAVCRLGDTATGTCSAHGSTFNWTGVLDNVSGKFTIEGVEAAVVGDSGTANCGHRFVIITGSPITTNVDGKAVARVTSIVEMIAPGDGGGNMTTGSGICQSE